MEQITIYPDEELKKDLDKLADEESRSLNNLILLILQNEINKNHNQTDEKEVEEDGANDEL